MADVIPSPFGPPVSFADDILPLFYKYRGQMQWRLDLSSHAQVSANAELIYGRISAGPDSVMPPAEFGSLTKDQIHTYWRWMKQGCPP